MRRLETIFGLVLLLGFAPMVRAQQYMLVPMDLTQTNHLKAYGLAYTMLTQGIQVEWLLNYRGGSFLARLNDAALVEARGRDVRFETIAAAQVAQIKAEIEQGNMEEMNPLA